MFKCSDLIFFLFFIIWSIELDRRRTGQSAHWTFSISFTRSNLDIIQLFLKHWIRLTQSYNYVSQSMWDSQRAYVDSSEGRTTTRRTTITQRSESSQSRLLGQILTLFNYFWSIEFDWLKTTIMSFKVCEIASAHKSIRAGEGESSWAIEPAKPLISPNAFAASNLRIFRGFLKRWSRLDRLYDSCHRKSRARERLVGVRPIWRIDRGAYDGSPRQGGSPPGGGWERHMPIWRSGIRGRFWLS